MKHHLLIVFCFLISHYGSASNPSVQKWKPYDFEFKIASAPANPYTVAFSAEMNGPDGTKLTLPGFYDGNSTWKIRFSPTKEGKWTLTTHSEITDLNNRHAQLTCERNRNKAIHGSIQLDSVNTQHFIFEDGTRWFPVGYEANWLWALDAKDNTLPTLQPFQFYTPQCLCLRYQLMFGQRSKQRKISFL